jgi:DNA polymerase-3 subunit epsilon
MRERFLGVVREEVASMGQRITDMTQKSTQGLKARWPLEEMLGADVLLATQRRIEARNKLSVTLENLDSSIWLKVDSFSLTQALDYLAMRLVDEFDVKFFRLRLQASGARAQLGPDLDRPGDEHRDRDELGNGQHALWRREHPADRARRG